MHHVSGRGISLKNDKIRFISNAAGGKQKRPDGEAHLQSHIDNNSYKPEAEIYRHHKAVLLPYNPVAIYLWYS